MNFVVRDLPRRALREVTAANVPDPNHQAEITQVLTVRVKDVPRILGQENTRLSHIAQQSGAWIAVLVDLRALLNQFAYIEITGNEAQVQSARRLIESALLEDYDASHTRRAGTTDYIFHEEMSLPLYEALHLLKKCNLVEIEDQTATWIEVDATKARRALAPIDITIHLFGAKRGIDDAKILINQCVAHAKKPAGPVTKAGRAVLTGARATSRRVLNGIRGLF